ncbi:MAG: SH3 domain-containing protein [Candidatus Marinimicrobia bacterium]|nr:SH3 domain-containing protein [Candidatus Neomarinimicrobiota bacterium]
MSTLRKILTYLLVLIIGVVLGRLSVQDTTDGSDDTRTDSQVNTPARDQEQNSSNISTIMWVQSNIVNVRSEPDLNAVIATLLYRGDTVRVLNTQNDWSEVRINRETNGWIYSELLSGQRVSPIPAVRVADTDFSVTEQNNLWWRYSYQVTLAVNRPTDDQVKMSIRFVNENGFELDDDITYIPRFEEAQEFIFRDTKLIDLPVAQDVDSIVVQLE